MLTTVLCLLAGALGVTGAAAQAPGLLRVADLSPDTPALDVAVAPVAGGAPLTDPGSLAGSTLHYGSVSAYRSLAPGSYAVSIRAAGAGPATPPVLSTRVEVPAGAARTVAVSGRFATLALRVLRDDVSAPPAGSARVRVLSGASTPPDGTLTGSRGRAVPLSPDGTGTSVVLPAGAATVRLRAGSGAMTDLPVALASGSVVSLVVLDGPGGGLTLSVVVDAAGPSVTPRGPVEAGAGGTAGVPVTPLVAGIALSLIGAAAGVRGRRRVVLGAAAALVLATVAPATAEPSAAARPAARPPLVAPVVPQAAPGVAPVRVRVPSAGVDAPVSPVDVDASGALVPPADTGRVGWFRGSPAPGDAGPAVLAGHVDSVSGPGAFFRIGRLAVGDPVLITGADGTTLHFRVTRVARYPKTAFPTAVVYAPTPDPELRLITCGGRFDRAHRSYVDDVVVFARID